MFLVQVMLSPFFFPVDNENFNFVRISPPLCLQIRMIHEGLCNIRECDTVWHLILVPDSPEQWLRREIILKALDDDVNRPHNH